MLTCPNKEGPDTCPNSGEALCVQEMEALWSAPASEILQGGLTMASERQAGPLPVPPLLPPPPQPPP